MSKALILAAGYVRMSDDKQEASPERQRKEIEKLAEGRYRIVAWYEDHGMTGTESKKRKGLQSLLADAASGKFSAVLMYEQSRLSRESALDAMAHWKIFQSAGVELVTVQKGKIDFNTIGGLVTAVIEQFSASDESAKIAARVASGLRMRVEKGQRLGGKPFGYDREFLDESGKVVHRLSFRVKFRKPKDWTQRLVISDDVDAVATVRFIFEKVCDGWQAHHILRALNQGKVRSRSKFWNQTGIQAILRNPVYCGDTVIGKWSRAKFARVTDEIIVLHDTHEGIVSRAQFEKVQAILDKRPKNYGKRKPGNFLLTGLARCANCGGRMAGWKHPSNPSGKYRYYRCTTNQLTATHQCKRGAYEPAGALENAVMDCMQKAIDAKLDALKKRMRTPAKANASPVDALERQAEGLRRKIAKATENLALADAENVPGINKLIAKWRDEEAAIVAQAKSMGQTIKTAPEAERAIKRLCAMREHWQKGDRQKLAQALQAAVAAVMVEPVEGRSKGVIKFHPGQDIPDRSFDVPHPTKETKVGLVVDYVTSAYPREVTRREIAAAIGYPATQIGLRNVSCLLRTARLAGLLHKTTKREHAGIEGRWKAIPPHKRKGAAQPA